HLRRVFDAGSTDDGVYVVSQIGSPIAELARATGGGAGAGAGAAEAGEPDLLRYAAALSGALEAAHAAGLVHGRLSPADLVEVGGQIKVSGVGLYGGLDPARAAAVWGDARRFLAPEVEERGELGPRADVFSMAAILAPLVGARGGSGAIDATEAMTGRRGGVVSLLARAMAPAPADRPARPSELLAGIRTLLAGEPAAAAAQRGAAAPSGARRATGPLAAATDAPAASGAAAAAGLDTEGIEERTIEESSPLFLHPDAAPKSPLFGPNAPTVMGKRSAKRSPPEASAPPAQQPPAQDGGDDEAEGQAAEAALGETVIQ